MAKFVGGRRSESNGSRSLNGCAKDRFGVVAGNIDSVWQTNRYTFIEIRASWVSSTEGTVDALLVRIEQRGYVNVTKVASEKGPPRKVYTLNTQDSEYFEEF